MRWFFEMSEFNVYFYLHTLYIMPSTSSGRCWNYACPYTLYEVSYHQTYNTL